MEVSSGPIGGGSLSRNIKRARTTLTGIKFSVLIDKIVNGSTFQINFFLFKVLLTEYQPLWWGQLVVLNLGM